LFGYLSSGGVPAVLGSARLCIEPNCVRLDVRATARAPNSEAVLDRLRLLAVIVGGRRSEIVVVEERSKSESRLSG
jgi:hypothetical protein